MDARPLFPAGRCLVSRAHPPLPGSSAFSLPWGPLLSLFFSAVFFGGLSDCPPWILAPSLTQAVLGSALAPPPPGRPLCFMSGGHATSSLHL